MPVFNWKQPLRAMTTSSVAAAVFPALVLAGYWIGGEIGLAALAVGGPLVWFAAVAVSAGISGTRTGALSTGLQMKEAFPGQCDAILASCESTGRTTACLIVEIDDGPELTQRFGGAVCDRVIDTVAQRILSNFRAADQIARLGDWRIGVTLAPVRRIDLETAIQLAARLQSELDEPVRIDGIPVYVSLCIGFCLAAQAPQRSCTGLIDAATVALDEARRHGPGAVRAYSPDLQKYKRQNIALIDEAARALDEGQIRPWFQPQVSTDTGEVTGIEALARWMHPQRGMISPGDFLPSLESAGLIERLGEVILYKTLETLRDFDHRGISIPCAGVNFTASELRNPKLAERLEWELDRFGLAPQRLCVEILESVVAGTPDDIINRNIAALEKLGCSIDLDDFGTGHASITSLRRFPIHRLKIDRSFIVNCDRDSDQQHMVTTILTMAEKLGLDTLAEGVESVGEHALLSQLGCGHVQGFGIAVPMPPDKLATWYGEHAARIAPSPAIADLIDPAKRRRE